MMSATSYTAGFIMLRIWSKPALRMLPTCRISRMTAVVVMPGQVMCSRLFQRPAPSIVAAS